MNQDHKWDEYFHKMNWSTKEIDKFGMKGVIDMVKTELNKDVLKILKIMKGKGSCIRLELDDQTALRFDRFRNVDKNIEMIRLEEIVLENYDCIPKIISYKKSGKKILKLSEWIDGYLWVEVKRLEKVNRKIGEMFAKLNNLKDPNSGLFITVSDINKTNIIWDKDENPIIVDLGTIRVENKSGIDQVVYKNLVKRVVYKDRIDVFLDGYSTYRDISGILKISKEKNWTFGKRKIKE
jgi:hypothetical protein